MSERPVKRTANERAARIEVHEEAVRQLERIPEVRLAYVRALGLLNALSDAAAALAGARNVDEQLETCEELRHRMLIAIGELVAAVTEHGTVLVRTWRSDLPDYVMTWILSDYWTAREDHAAAAALWDGFAAGRTIALPDVRELRRLLGLPGKAGRPAGPPPHLRFETFAEWRAKLDADCDWLEPKGWLDEVHLAERWGLEDERRVREVFEHNGDSWRRYLKDRRTKPI